MNLNVLKGILIILVIVDHNEFSRSIFPGFLAGFGFHVAGFMMIPFLKPAPALGREFLRYAFRQYYPFALAVTALALVVGAVTPVPATEQAQLWALSLYSGNSDVLKQTTHMALLWFLPSFIALVTLRAAIESAGRVLKLACIALACALHPLVGPLAPIVRDYLPLGLLPALYMLPLAYLGVALHRTLFERRAPALALALSAALFAVVKAFQMQAGLYNEVGFAQVAGYGAPFALILNDLECVTGVLMLFQVSRFKLPAMVEECGRHSMQLYLMHAFVALAVFKAIGHVPQVGGATGHFAVSLALTVVLTLALARWVAGNRLARRLVFPRSPAELLGRDDRGREQARAAAALIVPNAALPGDAPK